MEVPILTLLGAAAVSVLVVLSAFFSSSEIAVFSLSEGWLAEQDTSSDGRLEVLKELTSEPHRLLVTVLVANNVVNVAIASIISVLVSQYLPPGSAVTVATVLASVVVLVFGEILPKSYGLGHAQSWALVVARPLAVSQRFLYPVVAVFESLTDVVNAWIGGDSRFEEPYR